MFAQDCHDIFLLLKPKKAVKFSPRPPKKPWVLKSTHGLLRLLNLPYFSAPGRQTGTKKIVIKKIPITVA